MKVNPQITLVFDGRCESAFRLYEQCLNGTIAFMLTWGNSPMAADAPPGWDAKVYHATLKVGDSAISGGTCHRTGTSGQKVFRLFSRWTTPSPQSACSTASS